MVENWYVEWRFALRNGAARRAIAQEVDALLEFTTRLGAIAPSGQLLLSPAPGYGANNHEQTACLPETTIPLPETHGL